MENKVTSPSGITLPVLLENYPAAIYAATDTKNKITEKLTSVQLGLSVLLANHELVVSENPNYGNDTKRKAALKTALAEDVYVQELKSQEIELTAVLHRADNYMCLLKSSFAVQRLLLENATASLKG